MCRFVSIECRLYNKTQHYAGEITYFQFLTSLIMRVISASYSKSRFKLFLIYVTSEVSMYLWSCYSSLKPFHKFSCSSTISMRNITVVMLYKFTSAHIKVYAWYLSFNYCLSIWVINPNWTSEHNCLCSRVHVYKWVIGSPL